MKLRALAAAVMLAGCRPDPPAALPSPVLAAPAAAPAASAEAVIPAVAARSCARAHPDRAAAVALDRGGAGSTVALGRAGGRLLAYVADEDDRAVRTVDVEAGAELAVTPLAGRPSQLLLLADGRVAVAIADRAAILVLEPGEDPRAPLTERCRAETPAEPAALALTPDGASILVASRWGHALTGYAASDLGRTLTVDLPRDPRAVITSSDGRRAFVAHAAGSRLSVIDLDPGAASARSIPIAVTEWRKIVHNFMPQPRPGVGFESSRTEMERHEHLAGQGYALVRATGGRIFAPEVLIDPHPPASTGGYGDTSSGLTAIGDVAVIDEASGSLSVASPHDGIGHTDCLLPRAAAIDPATARLYVACQGLDVIVAYDGAKKAPHEGELGRWPVGAGPTGISVDGEGQRAVVWSQFDGALTVISLAEIKRPAKAPAPVRIALARLAPLAPEIDRGRRVFHSAGGRKIAMDGRACASCHPDGRDDAMTWQTPDGPRQTPMLLGRLAGTAPYGWDGLNQELGGHFARTISRLGGSGVAAADRDAIFAYLASLEPPVAPAVEAAEARIARGSAIFHSMETGCSSCHLGDDVTTDHARHDVKSHGARDIHAAFDTPSLRFIGRSAPYFHDGRYASLPELLRGADGTMGHTRHLDDAGIDALAAYLDSL